MWEHSVHDVSGEIHNYISDFQTKTEHSVHDISGQIYNYISFFRQGLGGIPFMM